MKLYEVDDIDRALPAFYRPILILLKFIRELLRGEFVGKDFLIIYAVFIFWESLEFKFVHKPLFLLLLYYT